ncbi:FAD/NAD(P)-binding protein [Streptomyces prunicolor]|uniref:FAD/NAD(P)-binding protein n=1 Tax=Streptomyces prunicolor TaxID=67348 RepID=UPI003F4D88D3
MAAPHRRTPSAERGRAVARRPRPRSSREVRNPARLSVCIIGAGPRGLSVVERICANAWQAAPSSRIHLHVVEPHRPGAGQVWRVAQSPHLLMNTVASQVTLFTDDSVEIDGPVAPGPSLYEWARRLADSRGSHGHDEATLREARGLHPDAYPTRAFYGRYLEWVFRRVVRGAPEHISVTVHRTRALALDDTPDAGGGQTVRLENGGRLDDLDAVVLAQGHVGGRRNGTETELARFAAETGLIYVPPANPADVDLTALRAGEPVVLRGLGLSFFDHLALLTVGRGGRFERVGPRLVYRPSGAEPRLHAGSRRGVPYHARGENEKGPHGRHEPAVLTSTVVEDLRKRAAREGGLNFRRDLWPLVATEVEAVYYIALLKARGAHGAAQRLRTRYPATVGDARSAARVLDGFGIEPESRWSWDRVLDPCHERSFSDPGDFRAWLLDHLHGDVRQARAGNVSGPLKAALDVLRDLRNEIRLVVDHGGLTGDSYRDDVEGWYTPLNAFLSIGPPVGRVEEMAALMAAGVLDVLGPGMEITADARAGAFVARSTAVPGAAVRAGALIEARLPVPSLRQTTDPLLRHLVATGQCGTYRISGPRGASYETGGLAVTERPYHLLDIEGRPHTRRFAFGVPTEAVHWVTAAGVRPGVNSVTLCDSDAIARAVLALVREERSDHTPVQAGRATSDREKQHGD